MEYDKLVKYRDKHKDDVIGYRFKYMDIPLLIAVSIQGLYYSRMAEPFTRFHITHERKSFLI